MMGKTHFAVGTATTLLLLHPQTVKSTLLCAGTAAICSCICDVDVSSSGSHKGMTKFCIGFGLVALILGVLDWRCEIGLRNYLMNNSSILRMLLGIVLLMGIWRNAATPDISAFFFWNCVHLWCNCNFPAAGGSICSGCNADACCFGFVEYAKSTALLSIPIWKVQFAPLSSR